MSARLLSFVVWALAAASAVYWGSRLLVRSAAVPPNAMIAQASPAPGGPLTRLFGAPAPEAVAAAAAPVVESRFKLLGVAAARAGQRSGLALIAMDDKPARALAVGARVDEAWVVQSIAHRQVDLGPPGGAAALTLTLPIMAEAARGVPSAGNPTALGQAVAPPVVQPAPITPTFQRPFGAGRPFPQTLMPGQIAPGVPGPQEALAEGQGTTAPPLR